jgi:penicillin-binding protein 1A
MNEKVPGVLRFPRSLHGVNLSAAALRAMNPARPIVTGSPSPSLRPVPRPPKRGVGAWLWRWTKRLVLTGLCALILAVAAGVGVFFYFDRGLPSVEALHSYQPPQVTKVYCSDGAVCAEFFKERRTNVDIATLPPHVKNAFLAAEDADFYHHEGLDYFHMARAALTSLLPGGHVTGASTITQQACRNLLLSQERTLSRKIKEWILTPRVEKALSKDEILNLYVNQIYFGHNRYGVEEAALFYFGKHAGELTIGEAASLAGTVQSPNAINPLTNMVKAKRRQQYVLGQLVKHGFLEKRAVDPELAKPIVLAPRPPEAVGPYYAEEMRRLLVSRYGEDAVSAGGLQVDIAMVPKLQGAADEAVRAGLEKLDQRQGYRGPLGTFDAQHFAALEPLIRKRIGEAGKRQHDDALVASLAPLAQAHAPEEAEPGDEDSEAEKLPSTPDDVLVRALPLEPMREGLRVAGFVTRVDDGAKRAEVDLVSRVAQVSFATVGWARPRGVGKWTAPPTKMSDVMKPGEIVRVRVTRLTPSGPLEASLDQLPEVQGALVSIDPATRHVVAMTGGYDFELSPFNRATQAKRQPGSAFKPFLYASALATGQFTTLSVVNDAPEAVRDPYTGKTWKPHNFEQGGFEGPMTLRQALTKSKNTVSVRLIQAVTPQAAIDLANKAGIRSDLPANLTLALGTGEVGVLELANAYATFESLGKYAEPITLLRVRDAKGTVLEEHQAAFEERLPPPVAYLATSLMRSVVEEGTAVQVKELARPAAGKTGTASEFRDAWFSGYTPDLVTTAWVGFDNHDSLGNGETGGHAALPMWLSFMKAAEEGLPILDFEKPAGGITFARIDPATGLLATSVPGREEPFLEGTAPTTQAPAPGMADPKDFLMVDPRGGH